MGKKRNLQDCVFTINLPDQPKMKFDYYGLMGWLAENPQRIYDLAPDWANKSRAMKELRKAGLLGESAAPATAPSQPEEKKAPAKKEEPQAPEQPEEPEQPETPEEPEDIDPNSLEGIRALFNQRLKRKTESGKKSAPRAPRGGKGTSSKKAPSGPRAPRKKTESPVTAAEQLGIAADKFTAGAKNLGNLASLIVKASTPKSNTNTILGIAWDDAVYQQVKAELDDMLVNLKEGTEALVAAIDLIINQMMSNGLTTQQLEALEPYISTYLHNRLNSPEPKKKEEPKPKQVQGVIESASLDEILASDTPAYVEIGKHNGMLGVYVVNTDKTATARRVFIAPAGRDMSEALAMARLLASELHNGANGKTEDLIGVSMALLLAGEPIGLVTTAREASSFNEDDEFGNQVMGFGKYAQVKLKDLFATDASYGVWAAGQAQDFQVRRYLQTRPEFLEEAATELAAQKQFNEQVKRVTTSKAIRETLKKLKLKILVSEAGTTIRIGGKTYDNREFLKEAGAGFDGRISEWTVTAGKLKSFLDALERRGADDSTGGKREDTTGGTGIRDPRFLELRRELDGIPDESGLGSPIEDLVSERTRMLLNKGTAAGIPQKAIDEQIEDVALISQAWQREKGMFVLASDPGTGKTFVLGGAIQELRRQGAKRFIYVTMNKDLVDQIKNDLKEFGVDDVDFVTYNGLRDGKLGKVADSDVMIFDEAHNVKKVGEARVAKVAQDWIAKARMTILASATPYENPTQMAYLEPTGIFDSVGGFTNFAAAYGAQIAYAPLAAKDKTVKVWWERNAFSDANAAAARAYIRKLGIFTQRQIELPTELVDMRLQPVPKNDPELVRLYNTIMGIIERKEVMLIGMDQAYMVNFLKRILEASKVEAAIQEARQAMERGRFPIIFTETKAERVIDIAEMLYNEERWEAAAREARAMNESAPRRSDYNLPGSPALTKMLGLVAELYGEDVLTIPPAEEVIAKALGAENIAVYNGSVGIPVAKQNLKDWMLGKKRLLLSTMAKGGTGLSLHDKTGNHPSTMIVLNLPWTATQVKQVAQRNARYGLVSKAEIIWLFAEDIDMDRQLSRRVGGRMSDMANLVTGGGSNTANRLLDWNLDISNLEGLVDFVNGDDVILTTLSGRSLKLSDFEPTNIVNAMLQAIDEGAAFEDDYGNTVPVNTLRNVLREAHDLTDESADMVILSFAGAFNQATRQRTGGSLILVPYAQSTGRLTAAQQASILTDEFGNRYGGVQLRTDSSPDSVSTGNAVDEDQITRGLDTPIRLSQGSYAAHYEVRELADLIPSHLPSTFEPNPAYKYVNERDYAGNAENKAESIRQAQNYQPDRVVNSGSTSVEGPPVILSDGTVLGGNGRTIVLGRVYQDVPKSAEAYRQYLSDRASMFGFTPEQIAGFKQPVLVRVVDDLGGDTPQKAISTLNYDPQKSMSETEQAVSMGRGMTPQVVDLLAHLMSTGDSLASVMASDGARIINTMIDSGMLAATQRAKFLNEATGKMSDEAKELIKNMLLGSLFDSTAQMNSTPAGIIQKLEKIAPYVLQLRETSWDIAGFFPGAIRAATEAQTTKQTLGDLARQMVLDPATGQMAPKYSLAEAGIASAFYDNTPNKASKLFAEYAALAVAEATGQGGLFMQVMSKVDAFNQVFPSPTGERVPQFVLDAQKRLEDFWKSGATGRQMNMEFGLRTFEVLGDLLLVTGYKLYKAGQTVLQWERKIAAFLGMHIPQFFGPQAQARRALQQRKRIIAQVRALESARLEDLAKFEAMSPEEKEAFRADEGELPEMLMRKPFEMPPDEYINWWQRMRVAILPGLGNLYLKEFVPTGINRLSPEEREEYLRKEEERNKRNETAEEKAHRLARQQVLRGLTGLGARGVHNVTRNLNNIAMYMTSTTGVLGTFLRNAVITTDESAWTLLRNQAKMVAEALGDTETVVSMLEYPASALWSLISNPSALTGLFTSGMQIDPSNVAMLDAEIKVVAFGALLGLTTHIIRQRNKEIQSGRDAMTKLQETENAIRETDPHAIIAMHLMAGTPLSTFKNAIEERQIKDAIRSGYGTLYNDGDLQVLNVDRFGEELYVEPEEAAVTATSTEAEPRVTYYPEMPFVEARSTAGKRWRIAHKLTGENLIPGKSFATAQAARKAYATLLAEFKEEQKRGQTVPARIRAERAIQAFNDNGTKLPSTIPIPISEFRARAQAMFQRGLIRRASYSAVLRYLATNPSVEQVAVTQAAPEARVETATEAENASAAGTMPASKATPAVKRAANRVIARLRAGAETVLTPTTRATVIAELKWRLSNQREDLRLTKGQATALEFEIDAWESKLLEKAKPLSPAAIRERKLLWDVATGRENRVVTDQATVENIDRILNAIDASPQQRAEMAKVVRRVKITPRQLGALKAFRQTGALTAEEKSRIDQAVSEFEKMVSKAGLASANKRAKQLVDNALIIGTEGMVANREMRQEIVERAVRNVPLADPTETTARIVMDVREKLRQIALRTGQLTGPGILLDQIANDAVQLFRLGLSRAQWLKQMTVRFGQQTLQLMQRAWDIVKQSVQNALASRSTALQKLQASLKNAVGPARRQLLLRQIDILTQRLAKEQLEAKPQALTIENLQKLTNLNTEQAEAILGLYQAIGIDLNRISINKQKLSQQKAMVTFANDGTALITAFERSDVSSFIHEGMHIYRRWLLNEANGHRATEIKMLERWAGVKDGNWTEAAEEKVAKAFERYIRDGKAPSSQFESLFSRLAAWMREIYQVLAGSPIAARVPKSALIVFERMFAQTGPKTTIPTSGAATLNQLIGRKGAGAEAGRAAFAEVLERSMAPPGMPLEQKEKVWERVAGITGWHRILEGEPMMFELDTSQLQFSDPDTLGQKLRRHWVHDAALGDLIDYPDLFQAYPQLKSIPVTLRHRHGAPSIAGGFNPQQNTMTLVGDLVTPEATLVDADYVLSAMAHEIEHAVQLIEGFQTGSNMKTATARKAAAAATGAMEQLRKDYPEWFAKYDQLKQVEPAPDLDVQELVNKITKHMKSAPEPVRQTLRYLRLEPYNIYRAATGEAMARLVQARRKMTAEERKAKPPRQHLKEMLKDEGLMTGFSDMPEYALVPGLSVSSTLGSSLMQSVAAPGTSKPSPERSIKLLEASLRKITDPARRKAVQAQIDQLRQSTGGTPTQAKTARTKVDLSKYDSMTVADTVRMLTQQAGPARLPAGKVAVSLKDKPSEAASVSAFEQNLIDAAGLPRTLMASADLSAPLRQGAILTLPPQQWGRAAKAFKEMLSSLTSQSAFSDFRADVLSHKMVETAQAADLFLASLEIGENVITGGEETFVSRFAKAIPVAGTLVKASERAYMTYLDSLRLSTFEKYVNQIERQGGTQAERRKAVLAAAKWINIATGRGTFEGKLQPLERAMPLLGTIFFAPRYVQSRLQLLNPGTYFRQPAVVRNQAWLDLMGYAATVGAIMAIAAFAGADVEWDPQDEDFLKIRFGNVRYDFLAGTQQVMRLMFMLGESWGGALIDSFEEAVTGAPTGRPPTRSGLDIVSRFMRSKLAPIPSFLVDMQFRKDFIGRPFELKQATVDRVVPMYWRESFDAYLRKGFAGAAQQVPSVFGVGVSDYEKVTGIFKLSDTPFLGELTRKKIEVGRLRPKEGESISAFKSRAKRTQFQLDTFGTKLVTSDRYQNLSEEGKDTAIRILRQRIGRGEKDVMLQPQMIVLAAIMADIKRKTNPQTSDE